MVFSVDLFNRPQPTHTLILPISYDVFLGDSWHRMSSQCATHLPLWQSSDGKWFTCERNDAILAWFGVRFPQLACVIPRGTYSRTKSVNIWHFRTLKKFPKALMLDCCDISEEIPSCFCIDSSAPSRVIPFHTMMRRWRSASCHFHLSRWLADWPCKIDGVWWCEWWRWLPIQAPEQNNLSCSQTLK